MPPAGSLDLPFDDAITFFRQKVNLPTRVWTDLWEGMHARAFVVAGAMKDELIADLREAVDKAIAEGTTLDQFRKDFDGIVTRHGWSYRGTRGFRTRVIFNTNLRMAYAAGKWNQTQRLKARRPFLRYVAILDTRTRPLHREWHDTVLPVDHDWWSSHYPPNGWNCRCTAVQLSERDLARFGLKRSERAPQKRFQEKTVNTPEGPVQVRVPRGIDPGFNYNVGEAAWGRGEQLVAMEREGAFDPLGRPQDLIPDLSKVPLDRPKAQLGRRGRTEAERRGLLREAIGGDEAIFTDPLGARVQITQAMVDHIEELPRGRAGHETVFPFIKETIEDPAEIRADFRKSEVSGRVVLRRRYIKFLGTKKKKRAVVLVADVEGGTWVGLTAYEAERVRQRLRRGHAIFSRGQGSQDETP